MQTRGVVFVHACPGALLQHAEWAISRALRTPVRLNWAEQPAEVGAMRAEVSWTGPSGTAAAIAQAFAAWPAVAYEVTEEPTAMTEGERFSYAPGLGVHRSHMSAHGDILIDENALRRLRDTATTPADFRSGIDALLGQGIDTALEAYRAGGDGAPVTRIHRAG